MTTAEELLTRLGVALADLKCARVCAAHDSPGATRRVLETVAELLDEAACVIEDTEDGEPLESLTDARALLGEVLR